MSVAFDIVVKKVRGQDHKRIPFNFAPLCDKTIDDARGFSSKGWTLFSSCVCFFLSVEMIKGKPEKAIALFSSLSALSRGNSLLHLLAACQTRELNIV